MFKQRSLLIGCSAVVLLLATLMTFAQNKGPVTEQERTVKEAEVPKPALEALKRLADKAAITEFAEEIEHGHRFYEGSWAGPTGNVDALVTDTGDLVEIEEIVPGDKVPPAVRAKSEKQAGKDAKVTFESTCTVSTQRSYLPGQQREVACKTRVLMHNPQLRSWRLATRVCKGVDARYNDRLLASVAEAKTLLLV